MLSSSTGAGGVGSPACSRESCAGGGTLGEGPAPAGYESLWDDGVGSGAAATPEPAPRQRAGELRLPTLSPFSSGDQTIVSLSPQSPGASFAGGSRAPALTRRRESLEPSASPDGRAGWAAAAQAGAHRAGSPTSPSEEGLELLAEGGGGPSLDGENVVSERERAYALYKAGQARIGPLVKGEPTGGGQARRPLATLRNVQAA